MKFKLSNLGVIEQAELELANLTILCGENNTGKTYITYAVYGFLKVWRELLAQEMHEIIASSLQQGYEIDLTEMFSGRINQYLEKLAIRYKQSLHKVFAAKSNAFTTCKIEVFVEHEPDIVSREYLKALRNRTTNQAGISLSKAAGEARLKIVLADAAATQVLTFFVIDAIADIVFAPILPEVFIASAERTGAATFSKELDFARTRLLQALGNMDGKSIREKPWQFLEQMDSGYPLPVQDNVDFTRQLDTIDKQSSYLANEYPEVLERFESILGGSYRLVKDSGITFQPAGAAKARLSMSEASSSVRALLDLGFYIRCKAQRGDLLMIDEPELNLHPKNQRALARLLVQLVAKGVNIFMSTHSDYIVKELNTLILFHAKNKHTKSVQSKWNYFEDEFLDPAKVKLFMTSLLKKKTRNYTLKSAEITAEFGIVVETFDNTIDEMNEIQEQLLYGAGLE
jgi:predicted ATPase